MTTNIKSRFAEAHTILAATSNYWINVGSQIDNSSAVSEFIRTEQTPSLLWRSKSWGSWIWSTMSFPGWQLLMQELMLKRVWQNQKQLQWNRILWLFIGTVLAMFLKQQVFLRRIGSTGKPSSAIMRFCLFWICIKNDLGMPLPAAMLLFSKANSCSFFLLTHVVEEYYLSTLRNEGVFQRLVSNGPRFLCFKAWLETPSALPTIWCWFSSSVGYTMKMTSTFWVGCATW